MAGRRGNGCGTVADGHQRVGIPFRWQFHERIHIGLELPEPGVLGGDRSCL